MYVVYTEVLLLLAVKWQFALVYLDDAVVFYCSEEEHIEQVKHPLTLSRGAKVTQKEKKCNSFTERTDYLGLPIRPGRMKIESHRTVSIKRLTGPRSFTKLKLFFHAVLATPDDLYQNLQK